MTKTDRRGKGGICFYCQHSIGLTQSSDEARQTGWHYNCELGIDNTNLVGEREELTAKCPQAAPRWGFQIGGYYTHMYFEYEGTPPEEGGEPNGCLSWHILSDGDFIREEGEDHITFHLCDFRQLEDFVKMWGDELRRRGWVTKWKDE